MVKRLFGLIVTVGAFLLAGGSQPASAQSWTEFHSKEGAFSILMPSKPARQNNPTSTPIGTIDIVMFTASTDSAFYAVTYSDFPSAPSDDDEANRRLDSGRDGGVAQAKGKLISETRITLDGFLGREIKAKVEGGYLLARVYSVKQRVYQIIMAGSEAEIASQHAIRFFNSFKLVKDGPTAQQPDWVEFSSAEGGFTVWMPGTPNKQVEPTDILGEKIPIHFFSHMTQEETVYIASYVDLRLDLDGENKMKLFLDGVRDGQVNSDKPGKLVDERAISLGGHPGREFLIESPEDVTTSRIYMVGSRLYQLFFVTPPGFKDSEKRGQRFFDSFKLTKR
jgi:hypothetical protein